MLTSLADPDTGDQTKPTGTLSYEDLRANPPGSPTASFRCLDMSATSLTKLTATSVRADGNAACTGLAAARRYQIVLTDNGVNPPATDAYRMKLFNSNGDVIYDSGAPPTTSGLGDLTVNA